MKNIEHTYFKNSTLSNFTLTGLLIEVSYLGLRTVINNALTSVTINEWYMSFEQTRSAIHNPMPELNRAFSDGLKLTFLNNIPIGMAKTKQLK